MAGAHGGGILAESHIAHVVDRFDPPVAAAQGLQLRRGHLIGRAAGEDQFGFFGDAQGFEVMGGAHNEGRLRGVGKTRLLGRDRKGIDFAGFMATVALVQRDVRREKKRLSAPRNGGRVCQRAWVGCL